MQGFPDVGPNTTLEWEEKYLIIFQCMNPFMQLDMDLHWQMAWWHQFSECTSLFDSLKIFANKLGWQLYQENYIWVFAPYCILLHLNAFSLRHDKMKYFMMSFSALFLPILMEKSFNFSFMLLCDKTCNK